MTFIGQCRRIVARVYRLLSLRVGIDPVTRRPIRSRPDLARFGNKHGAWTVATGLLGPTSIVYCVGCGEDISFDLALIDRFGCDVHGFDPTPRAIAHVEQVAKGQQRYHFHPIGLWDKRDVMRFFAPKDARHVSHSLLNVQKTESFFEADVVRLRDLQRELGHDRIDLLKLDIEGAEYKVLQTLEEDNIFPRVLCVEFDEFFHPIDGDSRRRIDDHVKRIIERGYELVHSTGNANYTFVYLPNDGSANLNLAL